MRYIKLSTLFVALAPLSAATVAHAQQNDQIVGPQVTAVDPSYPDAAANPPPPAGPPQENPIPPNAEGQAVQAQGGGYCFGGPHPAPGGGWEATTSPHMHDYAPFDTRLFSYHEGCYYFVGDPHDFGYTGESYSYYGAHPILDAYGGGWCFMIGAHTHWWRPWSSNFTVVGPWYYWNGPYDPFFWSYWPYYSYFYRSYYPSYYAGGRFFRTWRTAPAISHVPSTGWRGGAASGWRGTPAASRANGIRGAAPLGGAWRGSPNVGNGYRAAPATGGGWHGAPATGGPGYHAPARRAAGAAARFRARRHLCGPRRMAAVGGMGPRGPAAGTRHRRRAAGGTPPRPAAASTVRAVASTAVAASTAVTARPLGTDLAGPTARARR